MPGVGVLLEVGDGNKEVGVGLIGVGVLLGVGPPMVGVLIGVGELVDVGLGVTGVPLTVRLLNRRLYPDVDCQIFKFAILIAYSGLVLRLAPASGNQR